MTDCDQSGVKLCKAAETATERYREIHADDAKMKWRETQADGKQMLLLEEFYIIVKVNGFTL